MKRPVVRLRIDFAPGRALGPGKVWLLEAIAQTGSLSAAAAELGMSYKRAWLLLQSLNDLFDAPLAVMTKGGRGGGGSATVTDRGRQVIAAFRNAERKATLAATQAFDRLPATASRAPRKAVVTRLRPTSKTRRRNPAA
jgi:molybdate transport system regulatory protein